MKFNSLRNLCPWPTIGEDDELRDGLEKSIPNVCQNCTRRECVPFGTAQLMPMRCHMGLSFIPVHGDFNTFSINGMILKEHERFLPTKFHRTLRDRKIDFNIIKSWVNTFIISMEKEIAEYTQEIADYIIHNLQWPLNAALRNAELMYANNKYDSEKDQIDSLPDPQRSLVKALELLEKCLDLAHLTVNFSLATTGDKQNKSIFRLLDRFSWIFKEVAAAQNKEICRPTGYSIGWCSLYDSFEIVILLLLENAIKYSNNGTTIIIRCNDDIKNRKVNVEIESIGPEIGLDIRDRIFNPGVRGGIAPGKGLGLYFASKIAETNGFKINYEYQDPNRNIFSIKIPANNFIPPSR